MIGRQHARGAAIFRLKREISVPCADIKYGLARDVIGKNDVRFRAQRAERFETFDHLTAGQRKGVKPADMLRNRQRNEERFLMII
jgi:hypothetical protein